MKVQFRNKNSVFDLSQYLYLVDIDDYQINKKIVGNYNTTFSHLLGNKIVKEGRKIKITLHLSKQNESDYLNLVNYIYRFFDKEFEPFYYEDLDNNRRCQVELINAKNLVRQGTEFIYSSIELHFVMMDSLFEDLNATIITNFYTGVSDITININSIQSLVIYPRYEITINQSISNFFLQGEKEFIDLSFTNYGSNNKLIIDAKEGIIEIDKGAYMINSINNVDDGGFVLLYNGNNTLTFNWFINANIQIDIIYRENYIL